MYGRHFFGGRYFGPRYWGDHGAIVVVGWTPVHQWIVISGQLDHGRSERPRVIYNRAIAITKSDTVNCEDYASAAKRLTNAVYVGGAGIVVAVFEDDATASFTVVAGEILPIAIKRVNSTNTTASLMLALYQL